MRKNILLFLTILALLPINVYAFQLDVTYGENTHKIEVESSDTIEAVKNKVETATTVENTKQVLRKDSTLLEEGRTLADYSITVGSTITLSLKKDIGKIEYTFTEPTEGATPDTTADIIMTTRDGKETFTFKDVELEWLRVINHSASVIPNIENYKFEDKAAYNVKIEYKAAQKLYQEYDIYNYPDEYRNGILEQPNANYVINGIEVFDMIIPTLYVGEVLPTKTIAKLTDNKGTKEVEFKIEKWYKFKDSFATAEEVLSNEVAQEGYLYAPAIPIPEEINELTDNRTIDLTNGKKLDNIIEGIKPTLKNDGEAVKPDDGKNSMKVPETGDEDIEIVFLISLTSLIGLLTTLSIKKKVLN